MSEVMFVTGAIVVIVWILRQRNFRVKAALLEIEVQEPQERSGNGKNEK